MKQEKIIKALQLTLNQSHVDMQFLNAFVNFLSSNDLFTFASSSFMSRLANFLSEGENRDNTYEFISSFYSNILLQELNGHEISKLVIEILKIKEDLPIAEEQKHELGPLEFKNGSTKGYDMFMSMLLVTKLFYITIQDYIIYKSKGSS